MCIGVFVFLNRTRYHKIHIYFEVYAFPIIGSHRMTSLERSNVSVVTTMRRLQRSFDAIATKEGVSALACDGWGRTKLNRTLFQDSIALGVDRRSITDSPFDREKGRLHSGFPTQRRVSIYEVFHSGQNCTKFGIKSLHRGFSLSVLPVSVQAFVFSSSFSPSWRFRRSIPPSITVAFRSDTQSLYRESVSRFNSLTACPRDTHLSDRPCSSVTLPLWLRFIAALHL